LLFVADQEQGFEMAQEFIGAPVFGKFDGAASQVAVILLELGFEASEEGECVGCRTGESSEDFVVVKTTDFLRGVFDNGLAESDLSVAGKDYAAVAAYG
jgi:hypothetical protein